MTAAGSAPTRRQLRGANQRWALQHEFMEVDPATGIDRHVLAATHPARASSHLAQTADGTSLAYKIFGDPTRSTIAFCNGLGGTYRTFADVFKGLLPQYRLICHDYRGLFESGNPPPDHPLDVATHASDLLRVLDDAGIDRAVLFGWSMGVQVALEAYRQAPDRIRGMIFASGVTGRLMDSIEVFPGASRLALRGARMMQRSGGNVAALLSRVVRTRAAASTARRLRLVGRNSDVTLEHASLLLSSDPAIYWRMVERLHEHDASGWLSEIDVPVLVLHGDSDVLTPVWRGREILEAIPRAEMRVFTGCTHALVLEYPDRVARNVHEFLARRLPAGGEMDYPLR